MSKKNSFVKSLNNISDFINNLLEKNLNKLNSKNLSFLFKNNKIILTFVALFVIFVSYLLLPTFYSENAVSKKLKDELKTKLDLNLEFSQNIKYNFFPKPHFTIIDSTIFNNQKKVSNIGKLKIFISLNNFLSSKNIEARDIILEKGNFNLNKKNYNFFLELLKKNFKKGNLVIKDSNIFFRHLDN